MRDRVRGCFVMSPSAGSWEGWVVSDGSLLGVDPGGWGELRDAVACDAYLPLAVVDGGVVEAAQQHRVGEGCFAAVGPVGDVVALAPVKCFIRYIHSAGDAGAWPARRSKPRWRRLRAQARPASAVRLGKGRHRKDRRHWCRTPRGHADRAHQTARSPDRRHTPDRRQRQRPGGQGQGGSGRMQRWHGPLG